VSPWRRSPRAVSAPLESLRDSLAPDSLLAEAQRVWLEVVGPAIAAQATPVSERAGVLTVSCSASVWSHELELMAPEILERLNARCSRGELIRLRCVSLPRSG
jgi:predicted nucleic acid-binding Zn ribbon protein